ncbi:MAG: hypothetical protein HON90_15570 [Halobacteriovoraceae bacterium]|jgi:hypothetical protein|nr:hypothetical protein [Halobacteriovoraceae bacterium]
MKEEIVSKNNLEVANFFKRDFSSKLLKIDGRERRNLLEEMIDKIVLRSDGMMEIQWVNGDVGEIKDQKKADTVDDKFLYSNENGGLPNLKSQLEFPPLQLIVKKEFFPKPRYKDKDFLHRKYVLEGRSVRQIADEIFSSREAVRVNLMKHGVKLREPNQHHGRPAQIKYGHKAFKNEVVEHFKEQRVVRAVNEMKEQGMSLRAIARSLQELKIPTKCRGKSWHPEMVKRIIV